jgi:type I restriction enzyme M protein
MPNTKSLYWDFFVFVTFARDKTSLDITCLKDESLADFENLPNPEELLLGIVDNLEAGLERFKALTISLNQQ